ITFNIPTSWESEEIISSYLDVRIKGLGEKGIIAIFPKLSMIVVEGYNLNKGDKYFGLTEKLSKCMAKTYYPDILNYSRESYDEGQYFGRMG
ncbi:MAG: anaerobic ribonucleoside-triphosphate reductase, partial [Cetobacterium sp.]